MRLRPYQLTAIVNTRAAFAAKHRRVLLTAPTGAGKTVVAASIIGMARDRETRVLMIAHRTELLQQTLDKLADAGVRAGLIQAGHRPDPSAQVQVASIATLQRRMDALPEADLLIVDEAHHAASDGYRALAARYPKVLGLTATPWRTDGRGLADDFDTNVVVATPAELAAQGYLTTPQVFAYASPDLKGIRVERGDFSQRGLELACERQELQGNIVREYQLHGNGEPAFVFAVSVAHSKQLVAAFRASGFTAEHLDGEMGADERKRIIASFRAGELQILASCSVIGEGFDAPNASVAILAAPTMSIVKYLQWAGRVLRPAPGKKRALIHDHGANALRHGLPLDDRDYALTTASKKPPESHMACPMCFTVVPKTSTECPNCGGALRLVHTPAERRAMKVRDAVERLDMNEIRARRASMGARPMSDADLARLAMASRDRKGMEYLRLLQLCRTRRYGGSNPERVAMQMYEQSTGFKFDFTVSELSRLQPATRPLVAPPPARRRTALA